MQMQPTPYVKDPKKIGKVLYSSGWATLAMLLLIFYSPIIYRSGLYGISQGGWGVLIGIVVGGACGYLIGIGKAIKSL